MRTCHQHGGRGDEAIDHDDAPLGCGLQHGAHHGGDLEAAHGRQRVQRRGGLCMQLQNLLQHADLARQPRSVQARARARDLGQRLAAQPRQQQRGAGGVANAHLAQQQRIARQLAHQGHAIAQGHGAFRGRHGRALAAVARAVAQLAAPQARLARLRELVVGVLFTRRKVTRHAAVHHVQCQPMLACQHADGGAAGHEVLDHLPGHIHRIGRHAARSQPVVGREDQHLRLLQQRPVLSQDAGDAQRQRFQPSQCAQRLGLAVYGVLHALGERSVSQRSDGGHGSRGIGSGGLHGKTDLGPVKADGKSASIARRAGPQGSGRGRLQPEQNCIAPMRSATGPSPSCPENHSSCK
jgi:hypothetical protein